MESKYKLGKYGESLAADFLSSKGMRIWVRNWRCRYGEIDLIARDDNFLVFVEVKTRSSLRCGYPAESVDARKLARLRMLASIWIAGYRLEKEQYRIDVVSIVLRDDGVPEIEHFFGVS